MTFYINFCHDVCLTQTIQMLLNISECLCVYLDMCIWSCVIHTVKDITSDTWY